MQSTLKKQKKDEAISFIKEFQFLPGMAYGIKQPTLLVNITIPDEPSYIDWAALDDILNQSISADETFIAPPTDSYESAFLNRVLLWSTIMNQHANIPVFDGGCILNIKLNSESKMSIGTIAAPYLPVSPQASLNAIHFMSEQITKLFNSFNAKKDSIDFLKNEAQIAIDILRKISILSTNTPHFLGAAHQMDIPTHHVSEGIYQYGQGKYARLLDSTFTDQTSNIGARIARDKIQCATVLRQAGLPAPVHALAENEDQAVKIAQQIGTAVVVKPVDTDGGVGVTTGITNGNDLRKAYQKAKVYSDRILIEQHAMGSDYRITTFQGKVIWSVLRIPAGVMGDGQKTIQELIDITNSDPRRGDLHQSSLKKIHIDDEASELLKRQNLKLSDIPEKGQFVQFNSVCSISRGGTPIAVNEFVHPDNAALAVRAAQALRLDIAGIDLIISDISKSWLEVGAVICEVNGQPQLRRTTQRHIHGQMLRSLVEDKGRMPVIAIVGNPNTLEIEQHAQKALEKKYQHIGSQQITGTYINNQKISHISQPYAAGIALLADQQVDALVLHITDASILQTGLPVDRIDTLILASRLDQCDHILGATLSYLKGKMMINTDEESLKPYAEMKIEPEIISINKETDFEKIKWL